jgi:predicted nucleic acid-binding Zn ribbon protein
MGDSRIKDVSSLLSSFFDEDKLRRGERYSDFFSSWPHIVGPRLAAHSRVSDVEKGILVVEAEHPGWIQLLQLKLYPELALRGIVFRLSRQAGAPGGSVPVAPKKESPEPDPAGMEALAGAEAERKIEDIEDPEFKALLSGLRKTMLGKE